MGFFNKKELLEIEELSLKIKEKDSLIDRLNSKYVKQQAINNTLLEESSRFFKEKNTIQAELSHMVNLYEASQKELRSNVETFEQLVSVTTAISDRYKNALIEIAEYDFDVHKKAYLLNDFFQERAKQALKED